jgi:hypothetical protein
MRTMQELRIDIRDKIPELCTRLEMKAQDLGLQMIRLSPEQQESYYDHHCNVRCYFVLIACDGFREWLYDEAGNTMLEYESDLLDWPHAGDGERGVEGFYHDLDEARRDFPSEVQDCNRLLAPILREGRARGLKDEDLFEYTWLMMSSFLRVASRPPQRRIGNRRRSPSP